MLNSLIVFSHLRWDFVYQRPQHLMQRLAERYRIFFFEEPLPRSQSTSLQTRAVGDNVIVCQPHTTVDAPGFHDQQIPVLRQLVEQLVREQDLGDYGVWFYSPMALPLIT